jgi:hypothetical protein
MTIALEAAIRNAATAGLSQPSAATITPTVL